MMETRTDEIADGVFRLSTFVPDANIMFNQFVVRAEQPLLFHTGLRALFPLVSDAVAKIVPLDQLRWVAFGHVEADECGAMNQFLAAAPNATVAHGAIACMVQVNDLADRAPHPLANDDVLDLGGKRVRNIDTPHIPHGWDAHVLYEETTRTLFCGDLFTRFGESAPTTTDDIIEGAFEAEQFGGQTALTATTSSTIRQLAELDINTLALMHGPTFQGDCTKALLELGDGYAHMLSAAE
jgi:flavorubredoxin